MTPKKPVQPNTGVQNQPSKNANAAPKAVKAKTNLPAHYLLTVRGVASIAGNGQSSVISYQETIRCPELGEGKVDAHYLTHVLKDDGMDSLLIKAIRKTHGNCEAIRTHEVVSRIFVDVDGKQKSAKNALKVGGQDLITLATMRHSEMEEYVKDRKYNIDLELYTEADTLREAVNAYEKDKEAFLISQEAKREEVRIQKEMDALAAADDNDGEVETDEENETETEGDDGEVEEGLEI